MYFGDASFLTVLKFVMMKFPWGRFCVSLCFGASKLASHVR